MDNVNIPKIPTRDDLPPVPTRPYRTWRKLNVISGTSIYKFKDLNAEILKDFEDKVDEYNAAVKKYNDKLYAYRKEFYAFCFNVLKFPYTVRLIPEGCKRHKDIGIRHILREVFPSEISTIYKDTNDELKYLLYEKDKAEKEDLAYEEALLRDRAIGFLVERGLKISIHFSSDDAIAEANKIRLKELCEEEGRSTSNFTGNFENMELV